MESSDDDMPLAGTRKPNGGMESLAIDTSVTRLTLRVCATNRFPILLLTHLVAVTSPLSSAKIPSKVDATMDRQNPTNGEILPGISMANGDVKVEDTPMTGTNGSLTNGALAKRKARESNTRPSYAEAESSDDDQPLVWTPFPRATNDQEVG
jgi:hypothetical protein